MLWLSARVRWRLKRPKDFEEGMSQGSCPENCVGVSQGDLSWKLLKWRLGMASWVKDPALRLGQRLEPQQCGFCNSCDIGVLNSLHIKYKSFSLCVKIDFQFLWRRERDGISICPGGLLFRFLFMLDQRWSWGETETLSGTSSFLGMLGYLSLMCAALNPSLEGFFLSFPLSSTWRDFFLTCICY